jgi:hypothetical protein
MECFQTNNGEIVTQIMKENSKKWCLMKDNNLMLLTETRLGLFDPELVTYKRTTVSIRDNLDLAEVV